MIHTPGNHVPYCACPWSWVHWPSPNRSSWEVACSVKGVCFPDCWLPRPGSRGFAVSPGYILWLWRGVVTKTLCFNTYIKDIKQYFLPRVAEMITSESLCSTLSAPCGARYIKVSPLPSKCLPPRGKYRQWKWIVYASHQIDFHFFKEKHILDVRHNIKHLEVQELGSKNLTI